MKKNYNISNSFFNNFVNSNSTIPTKNLMEFFSKFLVLIIPRCLSNVLIQFDSKFSLMLKNKSYLLFVVSLLKKSSFFLYNQLVDYTASNYADIRQHLLSLQLSSIYLNNRLMLNCFISETDSVISLTSLYKSSNWSERELYDMFGIFFKNHPDLRRILTDYGFSAHPLKKEYPLLGHVELFYSDALKSINIYNNVIKKFLK